jgi:hypothetical protein
MAEPSGEQAMSLHRFRRALAAILVLGASLQGLWAADEDLIPKQFSQEQRDKIQQFLKEHAKPKRYIPEDAKIVDAPPEGAKPPREEKAGQTIKQYLVQITAHRPVPGQEEVKRADVYYYRPNPEKGKPGITIKRTVDVTTGKQVGETELLLNGRTPLAREELSEAVELAKEKSEAVQGLYKRFDKSAVHWEHLQMTINRKHESHEPGDRAVILTFTVTVPKDQSPPDPVRVIANVTKGVVTAAPQ